MIDTQSVLEQMPHRRWFAGKGRTLTSVEVIDEVVADEGPPALVLAIVVATYDDGGREIYNLPVIVDADGATRDAIEDVERLRVLGNLMVQGASLEGREGTFSFGGPGLNPMEPPGSQQVRAIGAEQSNTSIVFDEDVILKFFRKVEIGPNPDLELNRLLTNEGFDSIPPHVGEILYERTTAEDDGEPFQIDLGIAQEFIKDGAEGWTATMQQLHRIYDEALETPGDADAEIVQDIGSNNLELIERLGDATGSLHVTLSREDFDHDVAPEKITTTDLNNWADSAAASLQRLLEQGTPELEPSADAVLARIDAVRDLSDPGLKQRIHGDYHLGQVMLAPRGWMILDFEGEPLRPLSQRREKQSPLRDVAGMLRSFSYAAIAGLFERTEPDSDEWKHLEPWALMWEAMARDGFLHAYLSRSHEGRFLPSDRDELAVMLDVFEIDKALYEVGYERSHRPDWIRIPLRGIEKVVARSERT